MSDHADIEKITGIAEKAQAQAERFLSDLEEIEVQLEQLIKWRKDSFITEDDLLENLNLMLEHVQMKTVPYNPGAGS